MATRRSFRFHIPSPDSSKSTVPAIINSLQPGEKLLSIELMPTNSLQTDVIEQLKPSFCSVIWRQSERFNYKKPGQIAPLSLCKHLLDLGHNVLLHLSGRYLQREEAVSVLDEAKRIGVRNVFALKGEYIEFFENCGKAYDFPEATDLIQFIKQRYGDYFSVCVAGYPDCRPRAQTVAEDTQNLLKKVESGADFIITQALFSRERFGEFIGRCRKASISVPIIPGLWLFDTYERVKVCVNFCKAKLDEDVCDTVENLKSELGLLRDYGIKFTTKVIKDLLEDKEVVGVHLFSLNNLGLVDDIIQNL